MLKYDNIDFEPLPSAAVHYFAVFWLLHYQIFLSVSYFTDLYKYFAILRINLMNWFEIQYDIHTAKPTASSENTRH